MYDIYYEYKAAADYESIDGPELLEHIYDIDNAEYYIGKYLSNVIYEELNEQLLDEEASYCEFYDVENSNFVFSEDSIANEVFRRKVEERREIVVNRIFEYFDSDTVGISIFMEGTHWLDNYSDVQQRENLIEEKYKKILDKINEGFIVTYKVGDREFEYYDEDDVNENMEAELEDLETEYHGYESDAQQGPVYSWIENGMSF